MSAPSWGCEPAACDIVAAWMRDVSVWDIVVVFLRLASELFREVNAGPRVFRHNHKEGPSVRAHVC